MKFKKGCTLLDQKYKEGNPTWGCKSGVLDVEDVEDYAEQIKEFVSETIDGHARVKIKERIDELLGACKN